MVFLCDRHFVIRIGSVIIALTVYLSSMGIFSRVCNNLPIVNSKIVFVSFNGRGWSDNPRYIAEEILRQQLPYDLVWLVKDMQSFVPSPLRKVQLYSPRSRYELSTARVIVNNAKIPLPFTKKEKQFYIQTWHGDFPLKLIEQEAEAKLSANYVRGSKLESKITDLVLSSNALFSSIVRNSFWYDGELLEKGMPRNDVFFQDNNDAYQYVRNHFHLSSETNIALYCPTFRDNGFPYQLPDFQKILQCLELVSHKPWVLLVRFHPVDQSRVSEIPFDNNIINGSEYPDTQDLERAAQFLITDYSSVMYDFMLQNKPVILFSPDTHEYNEVRGIRPIYWDLPFIRIDNNNGIEEAIQTAFSDEYLARTQLFLKETIHSFDEGNASNHVVERIKYFIQSRGNYNATV